MFKGLELSKVASDVEVEFLGDELSYEPEELAHQ